MQHVLRQEYHTNIKMCAMQHAQQMHDTIILAYVTPTALGFLPL